MFGALELNMGPVPGLFWIKGFIVLGSRLVGPADEAEAKSHHARVIQFFMQPDSVELDQISRLVVGGNVKPRLSKVMSLDEAMLAEDLVQLGHPHGKVILHIT